MAGSSGGDFHRLGVALDDFNEAPAFGLGKRPAFLDADAVAGLGFALFVVRVELVEFGHDLLEPRVRKTALDPDDNGLGHLGRDDLADAFFSVAAGFGVRGRGLGSGSIRHRRSNQAAVEPFLSWLMRVSTRAMSRRKMRRRAGFSNWLLACWRRRLKISCRRSRPLAASSGMVRSLSSLNFIVPLSVFVPRYEAGANRQLCGGQPEGLAREHFGHAVHLEQHRGRLDDGDPRFQRPLALAHAGFEGFLCVTLLGKDANPDLAAALHVAVDGDARRFDLFG